MVTKTIEEVQLMIFEKVKELLKRFDGGTKAKTLGKLAVASLTMDGLAFTLSGNRFACELLFVDERLIKNELLKCHSCFQPAIKYVGTIKLRDIKIMVVYCVGCCTTNILVDGKNLLDSNIKFLNDICREVENRSVIDFVRLYANQEILYAINSFKNVDKEIIDVPSEVGFAIKLSNQPGSLPINKDNSRNVVNRDIIRFDLLHQTMLNDFSNSNIYAMVTTKREGEKIYFDIILSINPCSKAKLYTLNFKAFSDLNLNRVQLCCLQEMCNENKREYCRCSRFNDESCTYRSVMVNLLDAYRYLLARLGYVQGDMKPVKQHKDIVRSKTGVDRQGMAVGTNTEQDIIVVNLTKSRTSNSVELSGLGAPKKPHVRREHLRHLRTGEVVVVQKTIIHEDVYSYTNKIVKV